MKCTSLFLASALTVSAMAAIAQGPLDEQEPVDMAEPTSETEASSGGDTDSRSTGARARGGIDGYPASGKFDLIDENGDGEIDEREAQSGGLESNFKRLDEDGNGAVSREEYGTHNKTDSSR